MSTNWFLVLGLEFDPVCEDAKTIQDAIDAKVKEWSTDSRRAASSRRTFCNMMVANAPAMRKDLSDARTRARMAAEARAVVYSEYDRTIRMVAKSGGFIDQNLAKGIAKRANDAIGRKTGLKYLVLPEGIVTRRVEAAGYKFTTGLDTDAAIRAYEQTAGKKPDCAKIYGKSDEDLRVFVAHDFYEFACPDGMSDGVNATNEQLIARAQAIASSYKGHDQKKTSAENLYALVKRAFASAESRSEYDAFLLWRSLSNELATVKGDATELNGGRVSVAAYKDALQNLTNIVGDADQAELLFRGFCASQTPALIIDELNDDESKELDKLRDELNRALRAKDNAEKKAQQVEAQREADKRAFERERQDTTRTASEPVPKPKGKSKVVAVLLAVFLWGIGAHKFYLGKTKAGAIMLVVFLAGSVLLFVPTLICCAYSIIDAIHIGSMNNRVFGEYVCDDKRQWW